MDKYHIYEEIGKGQFSQVFKGREKKEINYVAIKRVDKSLMTKIVGEVQIMHKLNSPHILRFYDWYETKNNVWLLLEYCTGSDLESLLKQDGHLPENSIRLFAQDILAGLKYIHHAGIIYGDIRPKNFLIDEFGIVKFSDFKLARKIPKVSNSNENIFTRGFLPIMSPELLVPDGVHSFASDFWAFGCLLYTLRRGSFPFGEFEIDGDQKQLLHRINSVDPIENPMVKNVVSMSAEMSDLISSIMEKSPVYRYTWPKMLQHPFWNNHYKNYQLPSFPQQPAYDLFVEQSEKKRLDYLKQQTFSEMGVNSNEATFDVFQELAPKPIVSETPIRPSSRSTAESKRQHPMYSNTTDMRSPPDDNSIRYMDAKSSSLHRSESIVESHLKEAATVVNTTHQSALPTDQTTLVSTEEVEKLLCLVDDKEQTAALESMILLVADRQVKPIVGNKAIETLEKFVFKSNNSTSLNTTSSISFPFPTHSPESVILLSSADIESHLTNVYKYMFKVTTSIFSSTTNNSPSLTSTCAVLNNLLGYVGSISSVADVANIILNTSFLNLLLRFLRVSLSSGNVTTLSSSARLKGSIANTNPSTHPLLACKVLVSTILGVLIRYATVIHPPNATTKSSSQASEHILGTLVNSLKDPKLDVRLKRRQLAALGEILFYITSQDEVEEQESPDHWAIPTSIVSLFLRMLKEDGDEISKHYVIKSIENILSRENISLRYPEIASQLVAVDMAMKMLDNLQMNATTISPRLESLQCSAGSALQFILKLLIDLPQNTETLETSSSSKKTSMSFAMKIIERVNISFWADVLHEGALKLQVVALNIFNLLFILSQGDVVWSRLLSHSASFTTNVSKLVEHGSSAVLKAKALILLHHISKHEKQLLAIFAEKRLFSCLVKNLEDEKQSYLHKTTLCLTLHIQVSLISYLLELQDGLDASRLDNSTTPTISKKTNGVTVTPSTPMVRTTPLSQVQTSTVRTTSMSPSSKYQTTKNTSPLSKPTKSKPHASSIDDLSDDIESKANLVTSLVSIVCHSSLRSLVFASRDFRVLLLVATQCLQKIHQVSISTRSNTSKTSFERMIVIIVEATAKIDFFLLPQYLPIWTQNFFPSVLLVMKSLSPDHRVLLASCVRSMVSFYLQSPIDTTTASFGRQLILTILPYVSSLLEDVHPIPSYTLRLVVEMLRCKDIHVSNLIKQSDSSMNSLITCLQKKEVMDWLDYESLQELHKFVKLQ